MRERGNGLKRLQVQKKGHCQDFFFFPTEGADSHEHQECEGEMRKTGVIYISSYLILIIDKIWRYAGDRFVK